MYQLGLNITAWNIEGEEMEKKNSSKLIDSIGNKMTIDYNKTPFVVSGSNYVHGSPTILEYLI